MIFNFYEAFSGNKAQEKNIDNKASWIYWLVQYIFVLFWLQKYSAVKLSEIKEKWDTVTCQLFHFNFRDC